MGNSPLILEKIRRIERGYGCNDQRTDAQSSQEPAWLRSRRA